jgi:hypothetical protein
VKFPKFKVSFIFVLLVILFIGLVCILFWNYYVYRSKGEIITVSDFLQIMIQKKSFIIVILVLLSFTGMFLKKNIGWIFTTLLFYTMTIPLIYSLWNIDFKFIEIITYIPFAGAVLYADWILNSKEILSYFKIDMKSRSRLINNLITMVLGLVILIILYFTNVR